MIAHVKTLVGSGYARLADEVPERWKHFSMKVFVFSLVVLAYAFVLTVIYIWNLRAAPVIVTHGQARTYAGILAQVIAVLLLALYVESTTTWTRTQAEQREERVVYLGLGRKMKSAREAAAEARKNYEAGTTSPDLDLADSMNNDTVSALESMLLDHKRRSDSEGKRAVVTALQLFAGLIGEVLALSSVLAPTRLMIVLATFTTLFLLYLFGQRLLLWPSAVSGGRAVQLLSFVGGAVLTLAYVAAMARITTITVAG
jgi:hypothetical protein